MKASTTWQGGPGVDKSVPAGTMTIQNVAIPCLDPTLLFDVGVAGGIIAQIDSVADRDSHRYSLELWPGYVESHAHLGLPANFDDSLDDPRLIALQYLFHGVTHVVDMFGFPLVKTLWELGRMQSPVPYPELAHCGYAATSMRDSDGLTGHGVEFPAPVFMLGIQEDLDTILRANRERGATFLKVMFTNGTEQPRSKKKFSRLSPNVLEGVARVTAEHGIPCVLDCNTRDEVFQAYSYGFRIFAHSVRDVELSSDDWRALHGARFVSTLSGLRPMIMQREEFLHEYSRFGFQETQDVENMEFVSTIHEPFGIQFDCQESRTAALGNMRQNSLAALTRNALLVGTDCGNTGAFHGYSLLSELDLLAGDDIDVPHRKDELRHAATVSGWRFFNELSGRLVTAKPIAIGCTATFNLLAATGNDRALSALPEATVINGAVIDRQAVLQEIRALRSSETKGKVKL